VLKTVLRNLVAHKVRLVLSALAITLGVAFVSGTLVFTDTLKKTFDDLFTSTSANVTVEKKAAYDSGLVGTGADTVALRVPQSAVTAAASVPGAKAANGYVQSDGIYVLDKQHKVVKTGGAPGVGVSWDSNPDLSSLHLVNGHGPSGPEEVALDTKTVEKTGYRIGDTVQVLTPAGAVTEKLVGTFRFGDTGGLAGASLTSFDTATAQKLFGQPGMYTGVSVAARDGVSDPQLKQQVTRALGAGYDVRTKDEEAKKQSSDVASGLKFISIFLLVFAGIALFVGSFIILNTFSMLVAQRTRELALLRALGASRRQVTRSVLAEAVVLGVAGSTAGLGVGLGIAAALRGIFGRFGLTLDGGLVFQGRTVLVAYLVGVLVTVVAAYLPARRAAKVPPIAAMRDDIALPEKSLRRRTLIGSVVTVAGAALLALGIATTGDTQAGRAPLWVGLGGYALVIGAIVLSPVLSRPAVRALGAVLPRMFGRPGSMARENALRNPRRTAATASALMIGLTLVTAFSVLGASTTTSIDKLIDDKLGADFVVSTTVGQPFSADIAHRIASLEGVTTVTEQRFTSAEIAGKKTQFTAVTPRSLEQSLKVDFVAGSPAGLAGNGIIVDQPTAQSKHWSVGSTVPVLLQNGHRLALQVTGIYKVFSPLSSYAIGLPTFERAGGSTQDQYVYVRAAQDAKSSVRRSIDRVVAANPVVTLKDQTEFKKEQRSQVNQLLVIIYAMLVLSILIAVLGIVNTLALSVVERTHEIGLLRAIGMSRRQLRRMVRLESVVISLYGAALGVVLGMAFGVAFTHTLAASGINVLSVPVVSLVAFFLTAGVVGVLAAIWPARRAAKLNVLEAIATA
jgi:putative ABC transport system permease protein